ncbi:coiled-coil domain-containing protein 138 isoform X13 [Homo sapiens]|uniref:coiled-coil domain-containing protein 138 isoform X13 n=1 Tax=Homo sapiens TaxID=9606 RepID=UPI001FB15B37|nr:coiled-coil domain-containing protein 138 isoform X13 [Homo sapiens]XP_054196810.1 coiled-coil domain-containing protein 138 isoform X13 [Homo sapiens]
MEPRVVKPPGQDLVVESLKSRYGLGGSCPDEVKPPPEYDFSNFYQSKYKRRTLTSPGDLDIYSGDKVGSSLKYSDESKHCRTPLGSLFKHVNVNCLDDELDSFHDLKKQETEEELIENDYRVSTSKITKQSFKEIEKVALPTNTTSSRPRTECCSDAGDSPLKPVSCPKSKASDKRSLLPHQISQIYDELFQIHLKLQCETAAQQKFAEELQKRERFLLEREQLLFRHENALSKIKGVEEEVLTRFQIIKEQHDAEVEHLTEVLKEKNKETKRLRSSFDALKELNDTLKKQLNEASEENRKIDIQAKRVQARLDNLQRKYEFMTIQRLKGSSHAVHEMKSLKQEKAPVSKTYKVPLNGQVYELLTVFMDWISDHHLSKVKHEESGMDGKKPQLKFASQRNDIQEKCVKHSTMTSTLRRLGEDIFKGVVTKGIQDNSPQHSVENKPKTAAFFKSSNLPLRFLSTLIVLKTVTQESLQPFLEACSNSLFFRTCSVLLRAPKLDLQILEKLSIILQKLSKIKSNKKLFELFTIHLMLQEIQRTTNPEHAFLCINLNSTLFNLGLTKCNSLVSSASP